MAALSSEKSHQNISTSTTTSLSPSPTTTQTMLSTDQITTEMIDVQVIANDGSTNSKNINELQHGDYTKFPKQSRRQIHENLANDFGTTSFELDDSNKMSTSCNNNDYFTMRHCVSYRIN